MYFIYLIIFILRNINTSLDEINSGFLRTDCYESLFPPLRYIKISHYYPSGPLYLFIYFRYKLYSFIYGYAAKIVEVEYNFKKISMECETSIIFTTIGDDFHKLDLYLRIYLFEYSESIAYIQLYFYRGFKPSVYKIPDYDEKFFVHIKVLDIKEECLIKQNITFEETKEHLNLTSNTRGEICIITENNKAVVVKPEYILDKPLGLITSFMIDFYENNNFVGLRNYNAFECYRNNVHTRESVILIIYNPKFDISFRVASWKLINKFSIRADYSLKLLNVKYEYITNLDHVHNMYKKLFMMKLYTYKIKCHDNTIRKLYLSNNETIYFSTERKKVRISQTLEYIQDIQKPPSDPCSV